MLARASARSKSRSDLTSEVALLQVCPACTECAHTVLPGTVATRSGCCLNNTQPSFAAPLHDGMHSRVYTLAGTAYPAFMPRRPPGPPPRHENLPRRPRRTTLYTTRGRCTIRSGPVDLTSLVVHLGHGAARCNTVHIPYARPSAGAAFDPLPRHGTLPYSGRAPNTWVKFSLRPLYLPNSPRG